ncbi:MAG: hypothetical protein CVT49_06710 [candidate division Zixibacteria bacterium HGW-Zixibacteria-1]|nr:MAG: hypothetical protein CVT49_06710 [candidate division Zixibacteria bacterium HGW-Zixibacteria-1]
MKMKMMLLFTFIALMLIAGCASKGYVDEQIAAMQAKVDADVNSVKAKTDMNAEEITKVKAMQAEVSKKADMALNEAKGFENYQVIWEGVVNFDFDNFDLTQMAKDNLSGLGQKMGDYPRSLLEVAGHTDKSGSASYNMTLGMKRGEAVKQYLADQYGVALYRMFSVSYGEAKPVAMPDQKNAASQNRRVVLKLWGKL